MSTLHALDAGKDTKLLNECMHTAYASQKLFREYVSRFSVVPRRDPNGVWMRAGAFYGLGKTPVYMPLHTPFTVWEISTKETGVVLQCEYVLQSVGKYEVPHWVHFTSDLGFVFDRWFQSKFYQPSVSLGTPREVEKVMARAMIRNTTFLQPQDFLCCLTRQVKLKRRRSRGVDEDMYVSAAPKYIWCDYVQNTQLDYFEDGSETFPFHNKTWITVEQNTSSWAHFPFLVPKRHWILDVGDSSGCDSGDNSSDDSSGCDSDENSGCDSCNSSGYDSCNNSGYDSGKESGEDSVDTDMDDTFNYDIDDNF